MLVRSWSIQEGATTVAFWRAIDVWASALPFMDPPVWRVIAVFPRMTPSKCDVDPRVTPLATTQMMFAGFAPPARIMVFAEAMVSVPAICKIQAWKRSYVSWRRYEDVKNALSDELPEKVGLVDTVTPVVHL
jgi:hypothetical protein